MADRPEGGSAETRNQDTRRRHCNDQGEGETVEETIAEFHTLLEEHEQEVSGQLRDAQPKQDG
ncbi:hypothetical protein ACODNH_19985 (plasmid) [Haloarcula sp. NS06]|uniref:DUF7389 domain-containing protein n=1 Tax=Haloarcula sp. NS06 TaxID=3409688 RepID=UPI003DA73B6A